MQRSEPRQWHPTKMSQFSGTDGWSILKNEAYTELFFYFYFKKKIFFLDTLAIYFVYTL